MLRLVEICYDYDKSGINNFILWSGDSDFEDPPVSLEDKRKWYCLLQLVEWPRNSVNFAQGLVIFDIQKIKNLFVIKRNDYS